MMPATAPAPSTARPTVRRRWAWALAVCALGLTGACSSDGEGAAPATTVPPSSDEPVCAALAELGAAWDVQASGPELGDPEALAALADEQAAAIDAAALAAVATGALSEDVADDVAVVAGAGRAFVTDAVAWANGEAPDVAPTLAPGTTDAQRRIDAWALERCGVEVWP